MATELENQFLRVCSLCEDENVTVENLQNNNYLTDKIEKEYDNLIDLVEDHSKITRFSIHDQLEEYIQIDPDRISKHQLGNLEIKRRNGIVLEQYPDIEDDLTNNMIEVPLDTTVEEIGFEYESHYLVLPSYLQKNKALIQNLFDIWTNNYEFYIGINKNEIGEKQSDWAVEEAKHWFGPVGFDDLSDSFRTEGLTVYGNDHESFAYGLKDNMELLFEHREDEWIIQIEELLPRQSMVSSYKPSTKIYGRKLDFYTRYAHLILNEDLTTCVHIDGAVREYPSLKHFSKRHTDSDKNLQSRYHKNNDFNKYKIFKLDSWDGSIEDTSKILIDFFKHSPHILRFFDDSIDRADKLEKDRARLFKREFDRDPL